MRRVLTSLLAFAMAAVLAPPARAEDGMLVIVAKGPGEATLSLPRSATYAYRERPGFESKSRYALMAVSQRGRTTFAMSWVADQLFNYRMASNTDRLPAGQSTIRILTEAPLTLRLSVTGWSGTKTIRLDRPLRGGFATVREITPGVVNVVEDRIPFEVPQHNLLLHAVTRPSAITAASVEQYCTVPRGGSCGSPWVNYFPLFPRESSALYVDWRWSPDRRGDAYVFAADVAALPRPVVHYLLILPTA